MTKESIDILKLYLSEEEIKELVVSELREVIHNEISNIRPSKRMDNYERIISNAVYYFLEDEVNKIVKGDIRTIIEENVRKTLSNKDLSFSIFRAKGTFDSEDSEGLTILRKAVRDNQSLIEEKVKDKINEISMTEIRESLMECLMNIVEARLNKS